MIASIDNRLPFTNLICGMVCYIVKFLCILIASIDNPPLLRYCIHYCKESYKDSSSTHTKWKCVGSWKKWSNMWIVGGQRRDYSMWNVMLSICVVKTFKMLFLKMNYSIISQNELSMLLIYYTLPIVASQTHVRILAPR